MRAERARAAVESVLRLRALVQMVYCLSEMTTQLEQQVRQLQQENQELRDRLASIEGRDKAVQKARKQLLRGGWRILLPMVDRQRVVRSFSKLTQTVSGYSNPRSEWPTRDEVLVDARELMESVVRFTIRRRLVILLFSILAFTIPLVQIWLVVKQNEIIENQTALAEVQVYDIVSRSMTEGDRNARQMTGALLARSDLDFLSGVIEEAFGPGQQDYYRLEGVSAAKRRLEDAAFRGHLVRAVVGGVQQRSDQERASELLGKTRPMFQHVLRDGTHRVPLVLRLGRQSTSIDDELAEQVDNYFVQMGGLLRVYSRLAREARRDDDFNGDVAPFLKRLAGQELPPEARFSGVYKAVMQDFLFDLALEPALGATASLEERGLTPEKALDQGMASLRRRLGDKALNWNSFGRQMALR
jgi:hypothetical protein